MSNMGSDAGQGAGNDTARKGPSGDLGIKTWSQKDVDAKQKKDGQRANNIGGNIEFDLSNLSDTRNEGFYKGHEI